MATNIDKENDIFTNDKYKDKPLRFYDKNDHYELYFIDAYQYPNKNYTILSDIIIDLKNADKNKELHIWINSHGGYVFSLNSILQQILEFTHIVTITTGAAMSCGFMLWCCGNEKYVSPMSELLYHGISSGFFGKGNEISLYGNFLEKELNMLIKILGVDKILTKEELTLGKTSEVWLLGSELIERKIALDYSQYKCRIIPTTSDAIKIDDDIYIRDDNGYVKYEKSKGNKLTYIDILNKLKEKQQ